MCNSDVVTRFLTTDKRGKGSNLYTDGTKLINYNTIIAIKDNGKLYFNVSNYSSTTRRIQSYINGDLDKCDLQVVRYKGSWSYNNWLDEKTQLKELGYFTYEGKNWFGEMDVIKVIVNEIEDKEVTFSLSYNQSKAQNNFITRHLFGERKYFKYDNRKFYLDEMIKGGE